jgi:hypothetical protein
MNHRNFRRLLVATSAAAALTLQMSAIAADPPTGETAKQDAKDSARSAKRAAVKTGHSISHGVKRGVHKSAQAVKNGAEKVESKTPSE